MRVFVELTLLLVGIALFLVQVGAPPRMLAHASGNVAALGVPKPAARALDCAAWFAGALAAVRRMRTGAVARRE